MTIKTSKLTLVVSNHYYKLKLKSLQSDLRAHLHTIKEIPYDEFRNCTIKNYSLFF